MKYLLRIYNFLLTVILCTIIGGILFSIFHTPTGMGWDQLADFLGAIMISGLVGLIAAVYITTRLSIPHAQKLALYGSLLLVVIILALRILNPKPPEEPVQQPEKPLVPTEPILLQNEGEEVAMFYIQFIFDDGPIYFYGSGNSNDVPNDSIVISKGQITYAPPHFFPYFMKQDYQLVQCRGISKTRHRVQVEVNKTNGLSTWMSRESIMILAPEDLVLQSNSIEPLNLTDYPMRIKPMDHAAPITGDYSENMLEPVSVQGDFVQVIIRDSQYKEVRKAWLRWRKDGKFLVRMKPFL